MTIHTQKSSKLSLSSLLNVLLLTFCIFFLFACTAKNSRPLKELKTNSSLNPDSYTINRGDTLNVQVWGEPRVSGEVFVRPDDGKLTMPLINDVDAAGKSLTNLSALISSKLAEFINASSVSISVVQRAPTAYYLSGNFQRPGEYRSDREIKLLQAIATGGGFGPFADQKNIILIRLSPSGGNDLRYVLNYEKITNGEQPNPSLSDGDTITVK